MKQQQPSCFCSVEGRVSAAWRAVVVIVAGGPFRVGYRQAHGNKGRL